MALVGIYSYPKSGNTWVRAIIAQGMKASAKEIPDLHERPLGDAREFRGFRFFKHHGGHNITKWQGQDINSTHIIHIRRNPLDVFASYLNFISSNVTNSAVFPFSTVEDIKNTNLFDIYFKSFILNGHIQPEFSIATGNYFSHNKYWMEFNAKPIAHIRYEDLLTSPFETLGFLRDWIKISSDELEKMLTRAGDSTKIDGKFYWKQQSKNYLNYLDREQINLFLKYRGEECRMLGYPPEDF